MCNCKKTSSQQAKEKIKKHNFTIQEALKKIQKHLKP